MATGPGKSRERAVREAFWFQAAACKKLGSPFTGRLCRVVGDRLRAEGAVGARVFGWDGDPTPYGDSVPLRLAGSLRAIVIREPDGPLASLYPPREPPPDDERFFDVLEAEIESHADFILERLNFTPQTNEIGRSAVLYCGFSVLSLRYGLPLRLSELGTSAGLNLVPDRYGYRLGTGHFGDRTSPVQLVPKWHGANLPAAVPAISERAGCDLSPLDVRSASDMERMISYIWPDQPERIDRTEKAIGIAAANLPRDAVSKADAAEWLAERLAEPSHGSVHVILHTIAWQYFTPAVQARCRELIERAGSRATPESPVAWLSLEGDGTGRGAVIRLADWPAGSRDAAPHGRADFHGRWIDWRGPGAGA